jgi:hypothetical protein
MGDAGEAYWVVPASARDAMIQPLLRILFLVFYL